MSDLPPLPERTEVARKFNGVDVIIVCAHTDEAMREYALAAVAAEREACAQLCEDISDEYGRSEGRKYPELRTDAEEGAGRCAAAIRAR